MFCGLLIYLFFYSSIYYCLNDYYGVRGQRQCPVVREHQADIDTVKKFPYLEFKPNVLAATVSMWNNDMEERFESQTANKSRPELKIFAVPHSHNDPGWLKTFEEYYEQQTKYIIHNIVRKLKELKNMTFVWNEISFLEKWWSQASPSEKNGLKDIIKQGRLEITTGGWVMPDEACTHIYSLLDQYIEGHEWLRINLGISPKVGWSIDPFGHGPTVPYLLDQSGIKGTIIQRIHYGWKQWFAEKKYQDFYWATGWSKKLPSLIVHNMPLEIYSIKGSCGPHPDVCAQYDFNGNSMISPRDSGKVNYDLSIRNAANKLMKEYQRLGSITSHNVVLIPLGEDFSYKQPSEFDYKYYNYQQIFDYINARKKIYNAHLQFGTPQDYFDEIEKKHNKKALPTVKGDFFPYADMFSTGKAQYWTGFYTTRPYVKILARKLEHLLRTSEILFSLVFNMMTCSARTLRTTKNIIETYSLYTNLVLARRNIGLFQHHDGITGTSRPLVMLDYSSKLLDSQVHCLELQERTLSMAMINDSRRVLISNSEWRHYGKPLKKRTLIISSYMDNKVVIFNSITEVREVVVKIRVNVPNVKVYNNFRRAFVQHQIDPVIQNVKRKKVIMGSIFELVFLDKLPGLTAVTYSIFRGDQDTAQSKIYCKDCDREKHSNFIILPLPSYGINIQNSVYKLQINKVTGFIEKIYRKDTKTQFTLNINIGAYNSWESGAYLFKPDPKKPEKQVISTKPNGIVIVVGPITTKITVVYWPLLVHQVEIINNNNGDLSRGILIKNIVHFEKDIDTELFMRFNTDIQTNEVFYTDQNGLQYQRRVKVNKLGIEGNYYPITTMAWIQDNARRLTYITDHAQGASSFISGRLEVMLDRRITTDDARGLGEGVEDNQQTVHHSFLVLESIEPESKQYNEYELPSKIAYHLSRNLNYPVNVYHVVPINENLTIKPYMSFGEFPNDLHLMSLRTITNNDLPSQSCYMVLQRPGYSCGTAYQAKNNTKITSKFKFNHVEISNITAVSLTGLKNYSKVSGLEQIQLEPMEIKTYRLNFKSNPKCLK